MSENTRLAQTRGARYDGNDGKDVRDGADCASSQASDDEPRSKCFPIELFDWLPWSIQMMIPRAWMKVQSPAHGVLMLGVILGFGLLIESIYWWYPSGCSSPYCSNQILTITFVSCCVIYFLESIKQYDEDLMLKQKEIMQAKKELERSYEDTTEELDACLIRALESSAGLAEQGFEAKRRNFTRFLGRIRNTLEDFDGVAASKLAYELGNFILLWLKVFGECTIDPINKPKRVFEEQDLKAIRSPLEVAQTVMETLKKSEVRFISEQSQIDKEEVGVCKDLYKGMRNAHSKVGHFLRGRGGKEREQEEQLFLDLEGGLTTDDDHVSGDTGWIYFNIGQFGYESNPDSKNGYPIKFNMCCFTVVLLSPEHIQLLFSMLLGAVLLKLELVGSLFGGVTWHPRPHIVAELLMCMLCIAFVLHEFAEIDAVQQLETQLRELEDAQERLDGRRKKMLAFYDSTQQLTELWLHHTMPLFEVFSQLHSHLEDADAPEMQRCLSVINSNVKKLGDALPPLRFYKGGCHLAGEQKKYLGDQIMSLATISDLDAILKQIPEVIEKLATEAKKLQDEIDKGTGEQPVSG